MLEYTNQFANSWDKCLFFSFKKQYHSTVYIFVFGFAYNCTRQRTKKQAITNSSLPKAKGSAIILNQSRKFKFISSINVMI